MSENEAPRATSIPMERLEVLIKDIQERIAEESKKHVEQSSQLAALNKRSEHAVRWAASLVEKGKGNKEK